MRRTTKIAGAIGVLLVLVFGLWVLIAPGQLVKYPSDLDKTAFAQGEMTLFLDPETAAPMDRAQTLPVSIERHLFVDESSGSRATVQETSVEKTGPLPALTLRQRFVIDRSSLKSVKSDESYAYTPENVVDRAPFYAINFPFGTGSGSFELWKNEVGRSYAFRRAGPDVERDGVTLIPMVGTLTGVPATSAYIDQLQAQGIPKALTAEQMTQQLKAQGVDVQALVQQLLPELTPAEREATQTMLTQAVPLRYFVSVKTRLLVEPTTGAIVSLDSIDQTLTAAPDFAGFAQLAQILNRPGLAELPAVQKATQSLGAVVGAPPTKVFTLSYSQTPASVADFAAYAEDKAAEIDLVKTTIPVGLGILAAIALAIGGGLAFRDRRRPPAPPTAPAASDTPAERPLVHA